MKGFEFWLDLYVFMIKGLELELDGWSFKGLELHVFEKGLEPYVSQNIKDLSYITFMIYGTWAICLWELKGLKLYVFII